ncbi:TIGR03083 family protein [Micromonospora avicenniae]|uniref:TIGR03083 family protein n=2 Tax=Micromonospora avicenniae TaxID=1198245 RepID=A0A1N7DE73_9ACTN|nr:TIGR03083 family protein [Micromonospora avicenniae]
MIPLTLGKDIPAIPSLQCSMNTATWLDALNTSSERLLKTVRDLPDDVLARPSFADRWSVAQVLSHLGSGAEISTMLVQRGIDGDTTTPTVDDVRPIWQRWDALSAPAQREAWLGADRRHRALLASLDAQQLEAVRVPYFAGLLSLPTYLGYRLSEQSVHAWDIEVALDPAATIPAAEVELLWDRLDLVATRFRDADVLQRLAPKQLALGLPDRTRTLDLHDELHLIDSAPQNPAATVTGTAEALLRLIYGRNRPEDGVNVTGDVVLDDLRRLFPGF